MCGDVSAGLRVLSKARTASNSAGLIIGGTDASTDLLSACAGVAVHS